MSDYVSIVDYGMGNIGSLENMIQRVGGKTKIVKDASDIYSAEKLLLPGVGAFDNAMRCLDSLGWIGPLNERVVGDKIPTLCICLGMQLIGERSEEGVLPGLAWIPAKTVRLDLGNSALKIPHMGWSEVAQKKHSRLLTESREDARFYFVHSYHLVCQNEEDVLATAWYGREYTAAVEHENIYATQFHPEKSHSYGKAVISNFLEI